MFHQLRENREDFKAFWAKYFDRDLVVDDNMAYRRIPLRDGDDREAEAGFLNENLKPRFEMRRRLHFNWTGRGARERILVFLHFLRYYEEVLRKEGNDQAFGERDFFLPHFVEWLQQELEKAFAKEPERKPNPSSLHAALSDVFWDLERFRFIDLVDRREIRPEERDRISVLYHEKDIIQYRAMPGLLAYDRATLDQNLFDRVYGRVPPTPQTVDLSEAKTA